MNDYMAGLLTLPAIAAVVFILWLLAVFLWQGVFTKATSGYECPCGKHWGNGFGDWEHTGHSYVAAALLSWHHVRRCRHARLHYEYWEDAIKTRKQGLPYPEKPKELRDLEGDPR